MGKFKHIFFLFLAVLTFTIPVFVKADPAGTQNSESYGGVTVNATVKKVTKNEIIVEYLKKRDAGDPNSIWEPVETSVDMSLIYAFTRTTASTYKNEFQPGDQIVLSLDYNWKPIEVLSAEWAAAGESSTSGFRIENKDIWDKDRIVYNKLFKVGCRADQAMSCWLGKVFAWSQTAILLISTAVIIGAGIVYMTSAGNPNRVALAKKLITGALTGVIVIVLGRFFLTNVIGVAWL